ncbi:putative ABC transporter G family member 39 [Iris pallida]|uniref:ABC transporter G family member 39 n=1 Tax=Iris pallida TaxID=29817 RepID=A0AAX6GGL5_IRIPA|nr:putative ABC transporter G family member 39 [Iris pallida]
MESSSNYSGGGAGPSRMAPNLRASMRASMRGSVRENIRVGSIRAGSMHRTVSSWRGTSSASNIFGRSGREEDDEEALKWASLEKLPTYDRLRKGILTGVGGHAQEININELGYEERKNLLERLVRTAEEDNERFLLKLRNRMERVGIDNPTIEVRFEHLNVDAEAYVGNRGIPTFSNFFSNKIADILSCLHLIPAGKRPVSILHDVSGIIKPCRMTLLLGPPGCGKTTLLLALAGKLDQTLKVEGRVTYNGHDMNEFVPQRTSAYIGQHDLHVGEMTVRETLAFSARCQGVGTRYDMLTELSRREKEANIKPDPDIDMYMKAISVEGQETVVTDYILKILGLDICADTMVGDAMIRGISGGQKKRVTTGEMLVGPAKALFMDEISTGLDSSTTFQIINSLRQSVHILGGTAVIALLQPAPETYDLFDDIILLSDGQIVYQGPRENVLEFFESMGFKCPERKGVADFLQEVTSRKDQHQYWAKRDEPYMYVSVNEFSEAFQSFHVGRKLGQELSIPFDRSRNHPAALTTSKFGISKMELLKACTEREWLLMKRNSFVYAFKIVQIIIIALIAMSVFFRTKMKRNTTEDGVIFMGAMFLGVLTHLFNGFAELAMTIAKLPTFYKQRDLLFYPSWAYAIPTWILKIPISVAECAVWIVMTYYVIGLEPAFTRFLKHYVLLVLMSQLASGLFRLLAAVGREMVVADTFGSFAQLVMMVLGGFLITREKIRKVWIWGYWSSPLMYANNAAAVNEFLGPHWRKIYDPETNTTLGEAVLKMRGVFNSSSWYWIGIGALVCYIFAFNILFIFFLDLLDPYGKGQAVVTEEELREKHANRTGESVELLPAGTDSTRPTAGERGGVDIRRNGSQERKGMILPFAPLSITFDNVRYSVDMPQEMKDKGVAEDRLVLLKGVSGAFRPGVLTALMGVSGAGKTTLMDVLAGRKTGGYIEGDIRISGFPKVQETFARISGYCEQSDIHSPHITVYESLLFSAWLRLPGEVDSNQRKMFVEQVMELVELTPLRGSIVGLPGINGLSTEQRKRVTIAVELVSNPSIIFMDEPTSGLDARAAAIVMRAVRNTVDTGRTVVCTIHQPSIDIFEAFDELFLMKRGGEEIYVGPLGTNSCHLIKYFEDIEGVRKIPDGYNPATWMLEITSQAQEELLGVNFCELYQNSDLYRRNKALIAELSVPPPGTKDLYFPTQYSQNFFTQCFACLWKQHKSYWRNPSYTATRIFFTTVIAILFGTIFFKLGKKVSTQQDLLNSLGSMYAAVLFVGIQNGQTVQPIVDVERTVFYREKAAGMYSALPYAYAQALIEVPHIFFQTLIYGCIVYSLMGFEWKFIKFFWYMFIMFFTFLYFTFYGMMAVAMTPNSDIAAIVSSAFYAIWNVFAGYLIPRPRIPVWWRWYCWACPVAWTLYGLAASQFGDYLVTVEDSDGQQNVQQFLKSFFGFRHDIMGWIACALVGFALLFAFVFSFAIKVLNFQKR